MVGVGYQNDTLNSYTYGQSPDAKWMFEASQMFPFAGKRGLKQEMAQADAESQQAILETLRRRVVARVTELYCDLFLVDKNLEILAERKSLYGVVEEAALARYSSGMGTQQEVLMAQAEKYMILEREEMLRQKRETLEGMLNLTMGRDARAPLGKPAALEETPLEARPRRADPYGASALARDPGQGEDGRRRRGESEHGPQGVFPRCHPDGGRGYSAAEISRTCTSCWPPSTCPSSSNRNRNRPFRRPWPSRKRRARTWRVRG